MSQVFCIYCDESCHLPKDGVDLMVLGAVWCPKEKVRGINERLREIKQKHGLDRHFETKWTKVSFSKLDFYQAVIDFFFDDDDLHFRALIAPGKQSLDHAKFNQDHDTWYYKMYFQLLHHILIPTERYQIFLDIKDTRSATKAAKLREVLCNKFYDFSQEVIQRLQNARSHELELLQLADLLIGVVSYANRGLTTNAGKLKLVERVRERSRYDLTRTTLLREDKFNIFRWAKQEI